MSQNILLKALGQCGKFLSTHLPDAKLVKVSSTALAAQNLSLSLDAGPSSLDSKVNTMECAVIASKFCETIFDELEVLHEGIQNEEGTTFPAHHIADSSTSRDNN